MTDSPSPDPAGEPVAERPPDVESPAESDDRDQWKEARPERLLASGYYKTLRSVITGNFIFLWGNVILPRLVPYPAVFGIVTLVTAYLGIVSGFIDWGIWTGLQMVLARAIPMKDEDTIARYSRTTFTFKIINGASYAVVVIFLIPYFYPAFMTDTTPASYWVAFYWVAFFLTIRSFGGFLELYNSYLIAAQRWDVDFYMSLLQIGFTFVFKLLFFWLCTAFLFPNDPIVALAIGIAVAETFELIGRWVAQGWFVAHLKIVPVKKVMRWGFDGPAFKDMLRYGTSIVGRTYLTYVAETGAFLWLVFVNMQVPDAVVVIGYWSLAMGSDGILAMASDISGPLFPAMAESYGKRDLALCESYWLTMMKWFALFGGFGLFFYLGWAPIYVTALSGDAWAISGQMLLMITPALLLRKANDCFTNILQGINAPHQIVFGTVLRIPVMVLGGFLLFGPLGIVGMAITLNLMEIVFCGYMFFQIKRVLKVRTPLWLVLIPFLDGFLDFLLVKLFVFLIGPQSELVTLIFVFVTYFPLYFVIYPLLGAIEVNDFAMLQESLGILVKNPEKLHKIIGGIRRYAQLSPLYGKFKSENLE